MGAITYSNHYSTYGDVRGQLVGICALLPPVGPGIEFRGHGLAGLAASSFSHSAISSALATNQVRKLKAGACLSVICREISGQLQTLVIETCIEHESL